MRLYRQELIKIFRLRFWIVIMGILVLNGFTIFWSKARAESYMGCDVSYFNEWREGYYGKSAAEFVKGTVNYEELKALFQSGLNNLSLKEKMNAYLEQEAGKTVLRMQIWEEKKEWWKANSENLTEMEQSYDERSICRMGEMADKIGDIDLLYPSYSLEMIFGKFLDWIGVPFILCPIVLLISMPVFSNEHVSGMKEQIDASIKGRNPTVTAKYFAAVSSVFLLLSIVYWFTILAETALFKDWDLMKEGAKYFHISASWENFLLTDESVFQILIRGYLECVVCGVSMCSVLCLLSALMKTNYGSMLSGMAFVYFPILADQYLYSNWKYLLPGMGMMVSRVYSDFNFVNISGYPVPVRDLIIPFNIFVSAVCLGLCHLVYGFPYKRKINNGKR